MVARHDKGDEIAAAKARGSECHHNDVLQELLVHDDLLDHLSQIHDSTRSVLRLGQGKRSRQESGRLVRHGAALLILLNGATTDRCFPRLACSGNKKRLTGFNIVIASLLRFLGRGDERRRENRCRFGARAVDRGFDLEALAAQIKSYLRFLCPGLPPAWLRKPMRREGPTTKISGPQGARSRVIIAAILAFFCSSANAAQPPSEQCRAASKIEYNSAKKQYLLRNRFGFYVRNGPIWRRRYWYCQ